MIKLWYVFVLCLAFIMCSCAHNMALSKGQSSIEVNKKSIALLSVNISNQNRPDYQLDFLGILVCPPSEMCITRGYLHSPESPYKSEQGRFDEYLLSLELEPGTYNLSYLATCYESIFLRTSATVYLNLNIEIKPNSIVYLGHIDTVLREKKSDDEERAALFPLIDAAVVGYSTGTFDVVVGDRFDEDMKSFISEYPGLQNVNVEKSILPQWIRPENKKAK